MAEPLRVLIVEDSEDDTLLLMRELYRGGYAPAWERVDTPDTMRAALARQPWDVVVADYALPHFSGPGALQVLHESGLDLPLIIVSGTIGEERAAEMMRNGAHDVILKGNLSRLVPAIARERREAEVRRQRRRAEEELVTVNRGLRLLSTINEALLRITAEQELLQTVSRIAVEIGGFCLAWVGYAEYGADKTIRPMAVAGVNSDILDRLMLTWADNAHGHAPTGTAIRTGRLVKVRDIAELTEEIPWRAEALLRGFRAVIALPLTIDTHTIGALTLYGAKPDVFPPEEVQLLTEMANDLAYGIMVLRTRQALQEREAQYRTIVETAQEGIWLFDRHFMTTYVNERMAELFGYQANEMIGRSIFAFIDLALHAQMEQHIARRRQGQKEVYEFCFRRKDGSTLWVINSAAPIMDAHGQFSGAFSLLTDITERHNVEAYQREFARKTIEAATEGKLLIREREEILRMAGPPLITWEIDSADDLEGVRHAVTDVIRAAGMDDERIFDFILCISEATTNAVKHAGGGIFSLHRIDDTFLAVMADRGEGIPAINLPELALKRGYTTGVSLGMGYKAMISTADTVYLATGPGGTTVAIAMAIHAPEAPPIAVSLPDVW